MRALLLLLWCLALPGWAQDVQTVPVLTGRVIDSTGTLTPAQRTALDDKLAAFEAAAGPQMVVLIVPSTAPEDITSYAQRVADSWKIGRREVGDGMVILVAKNDRKVRIEVAKALEGAVPDLAARQIIQNAITPAFKAGDYAGGLNLAVDQLQARIKGENLPEPAQQQQQRSPSGNSGFNFETLGALFFIGVPVLGAILTGVMGRKIGSVATAGAAGAAGWFIGGGVLMAGLAAVVALVLVGVMGVGSARRGRGGLGGMIPPVIFGGGGGGGGFGGGGGGFSSGGGGDFGGGGASGDW
ncbi:hypothetical protein BH11PSE10_BH11PSE10_14220 [soil metagenome]